MPTFNFSTGPSTLPDIGEASYNGCVFSPLFKSDIHGEIVQDDAGRTTKFMDYVLTIEGYVTLPDDLSEIAGPMNTLRDLLTEQAGTLIYTGRGFTLLVNIPGGGGGNVNDVAWGPIPKLLDFQPLGGGASALVKWQVTTRIPELGASTGHLGPVLQFTNEETIGYNEEGYSTLMLRGVLEVPLTRPTQATRTLTSTVDNFRQQFMTQIAASIDLLRFRVTSREFAISADKRTMKWHFEAEELPPQGLPAFVPVARGSYSVAPARQGIGLCTWNCNLRVTYTVSKNQPRRVAWLSFLLLWRWRMQQSVNGNIPALNANNQNGVGAVVNVAVNAAVDPGGQAVLFLGRVLRAQQNSDVQSGKKAFVIDFRIDEGLYLDSKTITFTAGWRLVTTFSHILVASGIWKYAPTDGGNAWKASVQNISGWTSWLSNRVDASQDFIVDFGASG